MVAIRITSFGGPEVLQPREESTPSPAPGEVLIAVAAAGVNRPDLMQRQGHYPPPPGASDIPGLEVAGEIVALGPDAPASASERRWKVGDRVAALLAGGGYAEFAIAPGVQCLPIPAGRSTIEAAAIPETFFTVWTNVFERGRLAAGEWLLVHGGASGIGTTAIQLAVARGAHVIATAGTTAKCLACEALGAVQAINYQHEDFVSRVAQITGGRGVDVILDILGGEYTARNLQSLATDGRLVQIGLLHGSSAQISLRPFLAKRLTLTGSTLRNRSSKEKGAIAAAVEQHVWPLLETDRVAPVIDRIYPLADAAAAHARLESREAIGKLVLQVSASA